MTLAIKEKAQRQGRKPAREPSGVTYIVDQRKREPFGSDVTISAGISIAPDPKKYPWANPTMKINFVNVRRGKQEIMAGSMIKFHPDFQEEAKKVHRRTKIKVVPRHPLFLPPRNHWNGEFAIILNDVVLLN